MTANHLPAKKDSPGPAVRELTDIPYGGLFGDTLIARIVEEIVADPHAVRHLEDHESLPGNSALAIQEALAILTKHGMLKSSGGKHPAYSVDMYRKTVVALTLLAYAILDDREGSEIMETAIRYHYDTHPMQGTGPAMDENKMAPKTQCLAGPGKGRETPTFRPGKILLIGTLGSGKTTIAERLARDSGFPYTSIDHCRVKYGDGTIEGEERAWEKFLVACRKPAPGILEFCGMGIHVEEVRDNLLCSTVPVSVIWLVLPLDTCIARASQRQKTIPYPFPWAPVPYAVPLIHEGIDIAWDIIWSREPGFHAVRQEFSGTNSVDEIYSEVRKICSFP